MIWKRIAGSYKHSHKKITKSFEKALDIKQPIGQNSQLHSFTASQLHSFTASQLHSFTASQLRGSCAQINLNINYSNHAQRQAVSQSPASCLWAFFIHRLKNRKERKALSFAQLRKGL
ncbi:hypothetical protein E4N99_09115 [Treponema denticola]|uniref:hypothetical protein n=1 Tax=Treponema denticola TaxID=158 RepID=UPI003D93914E